MPTSTPIRILKRAEKEKAEAPIRETIEARMRLPALTPVLKLPRRPRQRRRRRETPHTVAGLLRSVIMQVNLRGMCAVEAARLAALPSGELRDIQALCRCRACARGRAH